MRQVSKRYVLRRHGMNPLKRMARRVVRGRQPEDLHWALRDIDVEIRPGESVALMGVNGSGKSTFLRTLMGVTNPTSGKVHVRGRVGGVVDLGAGFHADLTGFENIFLHGTLIGLSRADIRARLRSIEDFCELGSFLNTPVRHYSMGMFLRLGFSIAVHSDPDIFVIDEAMAVGDGYFQWKCFRKLEEFRNQGRTLLFVSHLPEISETLCERALWLDAGCIKADGKASEVAAAYHSSLFSDILEGEPKHYLHELNALLPYARFGTGKVIIRDLQFRNAAGQKQRHFTSGEDIYVHIVANSKEALRATLYVVIERPGQTVAYVTSSEMGFQYALQEGSNEITVRIPRNPLEEGAHYFSLAIGNPTDRFEVYDCHAKLYNFSIRSAPGDSHFSHGFLKLRPEVRAETVSK